MLEIIGNTLLFFAQYGIYIIIIISLLNFKKEARSLIAVALSLIISYGISSLFYAPRPFVKQNFMPLIPHSANSSFPSHHASAGFALSSSTYYTNTVLGVVSAAIALLMSIGRIYAGLHSPADIIAGVIIGALCAMAAYSKTTEKLLKKSKFLKKISFYKY